MTDILKRIKKRMLEVAETGTDIKENARLKEDAGLDSLSFVAVIVGLEDEFGITFDDGDLDPAKLNTLKDLAGLVQKYV